MATSELRKALTAGGSGSNLIPQDMERIIRADLMAKSPLLNLFPLVKASGNVHTVVKRTAHNSAWVESESASPSYGQSTFARRNVTVKIVRAHGQTTDFLQSSAMSFTDTLSNEIESASDGFREALEYMVLWGCSDDSAIGFTGDAFQYSGIYPWAIADGSASTIVNATGAKIALSNLDDVLDETRNKYQNLKGGQWVWLASPNMISTISGLQTLVRRDVPTLTFEGGFEMTTYNGVPLLSSGYVAPNSTSVSVAGLSASPGGTGTVTDGVYRYKVAAITLYGEQLASASANGTMSSNSTMTLTWTANASAKLYAIYRTNVGEDTTNSNYDLLDIIAARSYTNGVDAAAVTTYADTFAKTAKTFIHPLVTYDSGTKAQETIFLVYLDQTNGVSLAVLPPTLGDPYGGDPTQNLVRYVPINENTDTYQFRLKSYHVLQIPDAKVCAVIRAAQRNATA